MPIRIEDDVVYVGERCRITFQRTLRIPEDGRTYPLPPSLGLLPVELADTTEPASVDPAGTDPAATDPASIKVIVPLRQREALWIGFEGAWWKPNAIKVGVGGVDAIAGRPWDEELHDDPQDYLVCPEQPWLDGINSGDGVTRQFVATPLGAGRTVEAQLRAGHEQGGMRLTVYEPRPGRFPDEPPAARSSAAPSPVDASDAGSDLGIGAGGTIEQKVYPDPHGLDVWDASSRTTLDVRLLNSEQYLAATGRPPPPTPVDAETYTAHGLPWFRLYDEAAADLAAPDTLTGVRSLADLAERDDPDRPPDRSVDVDEAQIIGLRHGRDGSADAGDVDDDDPVDDDDQDPTAERGP